MKTARFHFDDQFHPLLSYERRREGFELSFRGPQSVKHLIESLGIPHTEIGRLKANGKSIELAYLVHDGDRIEIQPGTPEPLAEEPRFVLDCHLGRLTAHLRMLGLDCLYRSDFNDAQLAEISIKEGRILLTRDRRLLMQKTITRGSLLRSLDSEGQLKETVKRYQLTEWIKPFCRCLRCNHPLEWVSKEAILTRLKPLTKLYYDDFRICPACHQIYWKGSHYEKMQKMIEQIQAGE
jgi:uncharacterized protein with PIN domain